SFISTSSLLCSTLFPYTTLFRSMIIVAAATNLVIYYLEYQTLVLDDGTRASALVGFAEYLDISLTQTELRIGRGATPAGPIGELDRKSTRLNSSHVKSTYAVLCL